MPQAPVVVVVVVPSVPELVVEVDKEQPVAVQSLFCVMWSPLLVGHVFMSLFSLCSFYARGKPPYQPPLRGIFTKPQAPAVVVADAPSAPELAVEVDKEQPVLWVYHCVYVLLEGIYLPSAFRNSPVSTA